ncbi:hypothetical protein FF011L_08690 [Roseimaritima multifibrata]|uniref:Uncharacterized protein n=1 Tax=Roseimaritima multifibrata TaxID=1930274 RepID=A0A517MB64_9BACT|nr:hypothetical protein [Roseimaritima multifibrata]QDS92133.1 hypothetical protein FF011L_08690 [Roseimaritima multifibrata]
MTQPSILLSSLSSGIRSRCLPLLTALTLTTALTAADPTIRFDLPPLAVADSVVPCETANPLPGQQLVRIPLRISALIDSPRSPRVDQIMVRVFSLDAQASVADYAPRTEVSSPYEGGMEVSRSNEKSQSMGLSIKGGYPSVADGSMLGDMGKKETESVKYKRVAPVEVVAASGTLGRGKGVYFKLRATALQVLEGDKQFELLLSVPLSWRGGLLDVSITADSTKSTFAGLDSETVRVGQASFIVATFLDCDPAVRRAAMELVKSESRLRKLASQTPPSRKSSVPSLFRHVVNVLDKSEPQISADWLGQVLRGRVDPHVDRSIRSLPVDVRVAILDYQDAQQAFLNPAPNPEDKLGHQLAQAASE